MYDICDPPGIAKQGNGGYRESRNLKSPRGCKAIQHLANSATICWVEHKRRIQIRFPPKATRLNIKGQVLGKNVCVYFPKPSFIKKKKKFTKSVKYIGQIFTYLQCVLNTVIQVNQDRDDTEKSNEFDLEDSKMSFIERWYRSVSMWILVWNPHYYMILRIYKL